MVYSIRDADSVVPMRDAAQSGMVFPENASSHVTWGVFIRIRENSFFNMQVTAPLMERVKSCLGCDEKRALHILERQLQTLPQRLLSKALEVLDPDWRTEFRMLVLDLANSRNHAEVQLVLSTHRTLHPGCRPLVRDMPQEEVRISHQPCCMKYLFILHTVLQISPELALRVFDRFSSMKPPYPSV